MNGVLSVGFTGTQQGLSLRQQMQLDVVLTLLWHAASSQGQRAYFYDGDCPVESADQQARRAAKHHGFITLQFPPRKPNAAEFLKRNRKIVETCDVLIAAPETDHEKLRSGTWMTVRCARKAGKPVVMLAR